MGSIQAGQFSNHLLVAGLADKVALRAGTIGPLVEMHRHMQHLNIASSLLYLALNVILAIFALSL